MSNEKFMPVELYVKKPAIIKDDLGLQHEVICRTCVEAETVLRLLGVPHRVFFIEDKLLDSYPGWRDGGVERLTWWTMIERPVPYVFLDGKGFNFNGALAVIVQKLRAVGKFPEGVNLDIGGECHGACSIGGARPSPAVPASEPSRA